MVDLIWMSHSNICDGMIYFYLLQLVVSGGQTCPQVSEPKLNCLKGKTCLPKLKNASSYQLNIAQSLQIIKYKWFKPTLKLKYHSKIVPMTLLTK